MLQQLDIANFTVFAEAKLRFGQHLNVIIGENGLGNTHLLKLAYAMVAVSAEEGRKPNAPAPTKALLQPRYADKLLTVFRPETLGRLARRKRGRERCDVGLRFLDRALDVAFSFATNSKTEVAIEQLPNAWVDVAPVYLPTRELLTIFPNFVSVYEGHYLELEETWRDTCLLLGAPAQCGPRERVKELLTPLEAAMDGSIELDKNGRFYLRDASGRMEMPLVAEGLRKLGMLARLISTGALLDKGYLFWDEPEANLNPRLITGVARSILELASSGIQIFIATHSLFLLREIEILLGTSIGKRLDARFFGLHLDQEGVSVGQGPSVDDMGDITVLDEELAQTDRFLSAGA